MNNQKKHLYELAEKATNYDKETILNLINEKIPNC